jgi:hypothetical protein
MWPRGSDERRRPWIRLVDMVHTMTGTDLGAPAGNTDPLPPVLYPWQATERSGVLAEGRFVPTNEIDWVLTGDGAAPLADRHRVLSIGSNASPEVMSRKMARAGVTTPLAMTITRHEGVAVGHSAHVSLPGYIAAAPYRCARCVRRFVALHLDDDQIAALDATEPNYDRVEHDGAWIYASHWQVLAVHGLPVTLRTQEDLHATLREADPRWREQFDGASAAEITKQLAHDGSVNEWRHHWRSVGLTRHAGFP